MSRSGPGLQSCSGRGCTPRFLERNVVHCKYRLSTGRSSSIESYRCLTVKVNLTLCRAQRHTEGAACSCVTSALDGSDFSASRVCFTSGEGGSSVSIEQEVRTASEPVWAL